MRLLILHQAAVFGGAERTTRNLLSHLDRAVVEQVILAAPAALRPFMPDADDAFIDTAPLIRHGWFAPEWGRLRDDVAATTRILDEVQPDLALGMMHYSAALVTFAARRARRRPSALGSFRGPIYEYIRRYESGVRRRLALHAVIGATARLADRILVPSRGTAEDTCRRFLGARSRTLVIPNGIDGASVRAAAEQPAPGLDVLPSDLPMLCVAARLSIEKDVHLLIDAVSRLQTYCPCALVVVGDGPQGPMLQAQVAARGLADRVAFVGHRENVYPYMRRADLYVHTCQFEGFGYTMLEAMACGTAVIATDCPHGPREVLDQGRSGCLVEPGDPEALARGIAELLTHPERRARLAAAGLARAETLSVERMARGYEAAFVGALDERGRKWRERSARRGA
ncbi:MAG: glycosyltransferase [Sphingobacteriia bacterium]|nr:glycosyltransferase [Sphingobacteriia bacterium]NCC40049.1 glycosyltransferase [Gammaproteobacteria bacterium]